MITFENETRKTIQTESKIITIIKQCIGCPYIEAVSSLKGLKYYCNYKKQMKLIQDEYTIAEFCQLKNYTE